MLYSQSTRFHYKTRGGWHISLLNKRNSMPKQVFISLMTCFMFRYTMKKAPEILTSRKDFQNLLWQMRWVCKACLQNASCGPCMGIQSEMEISSKNVIACAGSKMKQVLPFRIRFRWLWCWWIMDYLLSSYNKCSENAIFVIYLKYLKFSPS